MFCPECGTENPEGSGFCEKCGSSLSLDDDKGAFATQDVVPAPSSQAVPTAQAIEACPHCGSLSLTLQMKRLSASSGWWWPFLVLLVPLAAFVFIRRFPFWLFAVIFIVALVWCIRKVKQLRNVSKSTYKCNDCGNVFEIVDKPAPKGDAGGRPAR